MLHIPFPDRLAALRKQRGLTQQALADDIGVHVTQLRRYEAGTSQPTLDVLRKLGANPSESKGVSESKRIQGCQTYTLHFLSWPAPKAAGSSSRPRTKST